MRSLANSLIEEGRIKTTEARAKELRPFIEKLVTVGKLGTLAARREVLRRTGRLKAADKLVRELAVKYRERHGGYTRIVKLPRRVSDGSRRALIEFV